MENEIILYQSDSLPFHLKVKIDEETVWLTQHQMARLFGQTKQNVSLHIRNCFLEKELERDSTVKEYLTVQQEGKRNVKRLVLYYNLDVIISVGYRVKSKQGTLFRIWASRVLKDHLLKGFSFNSRLSNLENSVAGIRQKVEGLELRLDHGKIPAQGIFFDGQVFDAWEFASRIIRHAEKEIILIDHYLDESTLMHLAKKQESVKVLLYSRAEGRQLQLDLEKANQQYGGFELRHLTKSHDRFLIIDREEIWHLGASLKDLGKRWFAFSRMEPEWLELLLKRLENP